MREAVWASFESADALAAALRALRERGYGRVEAFSPFAVAEAAATLPPRLHLGRIPLLGSLTVPAGTLPWVALIAGVLGGAAGYLIQWFANAWAYPQNAGGRPANAVPAFVFNTFESLVLVGSGAVVLALLVLLRLPRLWNPLEAIDGFTRATDDGFGLVVGDGEPGLVSDETERLLRELGASDVRRVTVP